MGAALSVRQTHSDPAQRHRPGHRSRRPQGIGRRSHSTPSPGPRVLPTRNPGFPSLTSSYPATLPNLSRTRPAPLRCYHRPLPTRGWGCGQRRPRPAPQGRALPGQAFFPPANPRPWYGPPGHAPSAFGRGIRAREPARGSVAGGAPGLAASLVPLIAFPGPLPTFSWVSTGPWLCTAVSSLLCRSRLEGVGRFFCSAALFS